MSKFLKGNYTIPGDAKQGEEKEKKEDTNEVKKEEGKDYTKLFEDAALKNLGGSIAFVMKSNKLIWDKDEDAE